MAAWLLRNHPRQVMISGRGNGCMPLHAAAHGWPLMTYLNPVRRVTDNANIPRLGHSINVGSLFLRSVVTMSRTPSSATTGQLWTPNIGIRFSPKQEKAPLYPRLDMPRFLHTEDAVSDVGIARRKTIQVDEFGAKELVDIVDTTPLQPPRPLPWTTKSSPAAVATSATKTTSAVVASTVPATKAKAKPRTSPIVAHPWSNEPPVSPLSFNISHDLFHAAKAATAGTPQSYWSHTLYRHTNEDGDEERVKVHYCKSKATMEYVCKKHFLGHDVLGFDLEWLAFANRQSSARENVSLIQLASPGRIGLFHVALFTSPKDKAVDDDSLVAPTFRQIMEDSTVSKVGVQVMGDCTRLNNYLGVKTRGVFELSHLFRQVKYSTARTPLLINKKLVSLAVQVHECLGLPLFKGESVRSSNWMRGLSSQQLLCKPTSVFSSDDVLTPGRLCCGCLRRCSTLSRIGGEAQGVGTLSAAAIARRARASHPHRYPQV